MEPIKSGAVQLRPLHYGPAIYNSTKNTTVGLNKKSKKVLKTADDSGIQEEERGESTCSDNCNQINVLSDGV